MDDRLKSLIDALRIVARQPGAEEIGLIEAERAIDAYLSPIRKAVSDAAKAAPPSQSKFWNGVEEHIKQRLPVPDPD
jgi:hypothetical protein